MSSTTMTRSNVSNKPARYINLGLDVDGTITAAPALRERMNRGKNASPNV